MRIALRVAVLAYIGAIIGAPIVFLADQALAPGWHALWSALHDSQMDSAIWLTAKVALVAVPANAIFGVGVSLWIVRRPSVITRVLDVVIDIPLAISPIIIGLALELAYAQNGWFGHDLAAAGLRVIFSFWGIVLASVFVSLPLVSRQVVPLLRAIGDHQEKTAATLGASPARTFTSVTLRSIQWATAYGVTLSLARVIGEYGAVLIVSGNIAYLTQTLTLDIGYNADNLNTYQSYVGAVILAAASVIVLGLLSVARSAERRRSVHRA